MAPSKPNFNPSSLPNLSGHVYVVTGGNAGIGYHTVFQLASHHAKVYLGCRNASKGNQAIAEIKAKVPNANISLLLMDLTDLTSVVAAAKQVLAQEPALHGLVNSAGIMATPFEMTKDGYEAQFQTNYLAHWVLTYHLLPLLQRTASASKALISSSSSSVGEEEQQQQQQPGAVRIVNVSSMGHSAAPSAGINFADINLKDAFTFSRYAQSKLANILHTRALEKRFGPNGGSSCLAMKEVQNSQDNNNNNNSKQASTIWTASLHPGNVDTQLNTQSVGRWFVPLLRCFGVYMNPEQGAYTSLFAVASREFRREDSGSYFVPFGKKTAPSKKARDEVLAEKLWEWTETEMRGKGFIE